MSLIKFIRLATPVIMMVCTAAAETMTFPMGSAGNVALDHTIESREDPKHKSIGKYIVTIKGTLTNNTRYPVTCEMTPEVSRQMQSRGTTLGAIFVNALAGASQQFSHEGSTYDEPLTGTLAWTPNCHTYLTYQYSAPVIEKKFKGGVIKAQIGSKGIDFMVTNNSDVPIEILWDASSIIDVDRKACRIMHNGIKYVDREQIIPSTTVPPQAQLDDIAIPTANVVYNEGPYGFWSTKPLLPTRTLVDGVDAIISGMPGRKVVLFLQLLVGGQKTSVSIPFQIASVSAVAAESNSASDPFR